MSSRVALTRRHPAASVMIVVKNDPGVARTLEILLPQAIASQAEVIVIDASSDGRLDEIRRRFPVVRWERFDQQGKRFTIPEQRNRALELAGGEYLIFLDANCEPADGWLAAMLEDLRSGEAVVCGPVHDANAHNLVRYIPGRVERSHVRECTTVGTGMNRQVMAAVGRFDESLAYGEDVDYFWRASDAGFAICSDPRVAVSHDWGGASEQLRRAYRYGRARAIIHKKHWRSRWRQLVRHEPHVWVYPLYLLGLPLALLWPWYLGFLAVPALKNRSFTLIIHHLVFAWGVVVGAATPAGAIAGR